MTSYLCASWLALDASIYQRMRQSFSRRGTYGADNLLPAPAPVVSCSCAHMAVGPSSPLPLLGGSLNETTHTGSPSSRAWSNSYISLAVRGPEPTQLLSHRKLSRYQTIPSWTIVGLWRICLWRAICTGPCVRVRPILWTWQGPAVLPSPFWTILTQGSIQLPASPSVPSPRIWKLISEMRQAMYIRSLLHAVWTARALALPCRGTPSRCATAAGQWLPHRVHSNVSWTTSLSNVLSSRASTSFAFFLLCWVLVEAEVWLCYKELCYSYIYRVPFNTALGWVMMVSCLFAIRLSTFFNFQTVRLCNCFYKCFTRTKRPFVCNIRVLITRLSRCSGDLFYSHFLDIYQELSFELFIAPKGTGYQERTSQWTFMWTGKFSELASGLVKGGGELLRWLTQHSYGPFLF